ncbi:MAG TPA: NAD(P)H-dependent oxidoreductase [Terracidiphilus sp.]|nr:NAD(P)H-dependent oxidoreductase [Terracidiphilus sp.]
MTDKIRIAVIYGSTRPGRFCDVVVRWTVDQLAASQDFLLDVIDPGEQPERPHIGSGSAQSLQQRIGEADAYVVVTPEYNHGYPAPLKALIDSAGAEWHAKPVAFVSYGGVSGGLRAVEQLRLVFAELHAVTIRDSVCFPGAWEQFDESGALRNPDRARRGFDALLARLSWWAIALRNARSIAPYATAV